MMEKPPQAQSSDAHETEPEQYEFFDDQLERDDLFLYVQRIAEYLRTEKIPNLVIIDRSSRPLYAGLREYFRIKYPDEVAPNIYFMNPKGFKAREAMTTAELFFIMQDNVLKDDSKESLYRIRSEEDILADLEESYKKLMLDKDKPVMVFDTCIHSGRSLQPIQDYLDKAGFSDVRIGTINPAENGAKIVPDFYVTTDEPEKGCYPFDRDKIIEKTFDSVYSKRSADPEKRNKAIRLRKEIKKIVADFLANK